MSRLQTAYRWKTSDFDRLPDDPLLRYEIIDGDLVMSRRPPLHHAEMIMTLGSFLYSESSLTTDYVHKRSLYERTGTQEYWIVDRFERRVQVWQFIGQHATSVSYGDADALTTPLISGLTISVQAIWS